MPHELIQALGVGDGAIIPGGCEHCDAEQLVRLVSGSYAQIAVRHDERCPTLRARVTAPR